MARHAFSVLALAALTTLAATQAVAQAQTQAAQTITVTGRSSGQGASVAGFGDTPAWRMPLSTTVISLSQLQDAGIAGLGDLTRLDASATDAYNPPGYWAQLGVRGFIVDNRFNYRRDGLPINAETAITLDNKQALELLKGTSGLQAGTSAPGGLVNLVVKRPGPNLLLASLGFEQDGTLRAQADVAGRAGAEGALGWRVNIGAARLEPQVQGTRGSSWSAAAAIDARLGARTLLEAEVELSRQSQPSVPGFSLLGPRLPAAASINPTTNLNNQPWSLPVVFNGRTGSLKLTQELSSTMAITAHAMRQSLRTDDRIAFPFGCSAEGDYSRYCSDGTFDLYDFRSEGERRTSDAAELALAGKANTAGLAHQFKAGVLATRYQARFNRQAFNFVGVGSIVGQTVVSPDLTRTGESTQRSERGSEWFVQDAMTINPAVSLWAGLRHSRLHRESVATDGSNATQYSQAFTTPWLALAVTVMPQATAYASWGEGVESDVVPGLPTYTNAGRPLPALKSRQAELGMKQSGQALDWRVAAFDIHRPAWADAGSCDVTSSCTRVLDGAGRHRGVEAEAEWRGGDVSLRGSAMWLKARREGSATAAVNGLQPTNVPAANLKLQGTYNLSTLPGLAFIGFATHEGRRMVLPDNSQATPGWTRIDVALRYAQAWQGSRLVWRLGVDNVADTRAWKESPYQYGHAYLYPMAPRSLHASVQVRF